METDSKEKKRETTKLILEQLASRIMNWIGKKVGWSTRIKRPKDVISSFLSIIDSEIIGTDPLLINWCFSAIPLSISKRLHELFARLGNRVKIVFKICGTIFFVSVSRIEIRVNARWQRIATRRCDTIRRCVQGAIYSGMLANQGRAVSGIIRLFLYENFVVPTWKEDKNRGETLNQGFGAGSQKPHKL